MHCLYKKSQTSLVTSMVEQGRDCGLQWQCNIWSEITNYKVNHEVLSKFVIVTALLNKTILKGKPTCFESELNYCFATALKNDICVHIYINI